MSQFHVGVNTIPNLEIDELSHFLVARADRMYVPVFMGRITPHVGIFDGSAECRAVPGLETISVSIQSHVLMLREEMLPYKAAITRK